MCCQDDEVLDLPAPAIEALAHYRRLLDERGWDWGGEDLPEFFRNARFSRLGDVMAALGRTGDWAAAVREVVDAVGGDPGVLHVVDGSAVDGPRRLAVAGRPTPVDVVVEASPGTTIDLDGRAVTVPDTGIVLDAIEVDGARPVVRIGPTDVRAVDVRESVDLTLRADDRSRWSVLDETGGAWFPEGAPPKWDAAHRPFFHAREVTLTVPAAPLEITCARGPEFAPETSVVDPREQAVVGTTLRRTHRPAWHSADLHVHLNYSGDLVVDPGQARAMQGGEDLALMSLTAGNLSGALVYDRELLESTVGHDLWHDERHVARAGVEFRNDLLGHVHALGLTRPPTRYQTGHDGAEHPHDWPPNATACADLRERDATVGYAHPVFDGADEMFAIARIPEARSLVVDAALGLVDSIDLVHCWGPRGTAALYRRLLNCGLRLAATAGSDVFLSFAHGPGVASNPPGWGRMYADLRGEPLSVAAFQEAVRAGRTLATNGPFPTISVAGSGPGAVVAGDELEVRVTVEGEYDGTLRLVGPDGVVAETRDRELETTVRGDSPGWFAAAFEGGPHPLAPEMPVFAHTTPVHVETRDGSRIARPDDARWCLAFLDRLEAHLDEHGRFAEDPSQRARQRADHADVLDRARSFYSGI
ncbi:CehA/McbA family metallohydrolase [Actinomycetospora atypica]|uniref:CehA/McbA family metallohydrolase n=1 Tax=Actinomycetospora atypica TaxID=1290095 RepID=A0ABV9YRZ3_9PSEU